MNLSWWYFCDLQLMDLFPDLVDLNNGFVSGIISLALPTHIVHMAKLPSGLVVFVYGEGEGFVSTCPSVRFLILIVSPAIIQTCDSGKIEYSIWFHSWYVHLVVTRVSV